MCCVSVLIGVHAKQKIVVGSLRKQSSALSRIAEGNPIAPRALQTADISLAVALWHKWGGVALVRNRPLLTGQGRSHDIGASYQDAFVLFRGGGVTLQEPVSTWLNGGQYKVPNIR